MKLISYWTEITTIYESDSFVVITGKYNHKNEDAEGGDKCIGLYWKNRDGGVGFPNARGYLAPIVLEDKFNEGFLQFILFQAIKDKNLSCIDNIKVAIDQLL